MPSVTDNNIGPIEITTELPGLALRHMTTVADDAQYFEYQQRNKAHIAEFGNAIDESVAAVTERRLRNGNGSFGIWYEGTLIGSVGYSTRYNAREAEIGVTLDKAATGHGYATVAVKALTAFALPRFDRVFAEVDPDNLKSINLLKRSGYQTSGVRELRDWGEALVFEATR